MSAEKKLFIGLAAGIGALFVVLLLLTRLKWGDPIIDTGRELEIPWKVSLGDVLYKDMAYNYGPFSPYLNALFLKIFGVRLASIVDRLFMSPYITVTDVAELTGVTPPTARADIRRMVGCGILENLTGRRPVLYFAPAVFRACYSEK